MNTTYHGFDKSSKFSNGNVNFTCNGAYVRNHNQVNHSGSFVENIIGFVKMVAFVGLSFGGIATIAHYLITSGIIH